MYPFIAPILRGLYQPPGKNGEAKGTQAIPTTNPVPVGSPGGIADVEQPGRSSARLTGPNGTYVGNGSSALPSLGRGDDIPAALYPDGVSTGVGGGNAGQAQSIDPNAGAYIPPTPKPVKEESGGNDSRTDVRDGYPGTNTGFKGFDIDVTGYANINDFLSESLPVSPSEKPLNPGGAVTNTETVVEGASAAALGMKAGQSYTETADNNRAITIEPGMGAAAMGLAASSAYDTAADRGNRANAAYGTPEKTAPAPKSAPKFSGAVDDRFADGAEYGETYATNYDPRRTAQRNAFLSDEYSNSVDAVRASNRAIGVDRIGMKFYANDNGQAQEISQEAYDKHRSSGLSAQEFKDGRVGEIKATLVPAETPDITNITNKTSAINDATGGIAERPADKGEVNYADAQVVEFGINNNPPTGGEEQLAKRYKENYFDK